MDIDMEMNIPVFSSQLDHTPALNEYFTSAVQLSKDNIRKSVKVAIPLIQDLLNYVHEKDPRFKNDMVRVGSYWQGLKVNKADEFDVSVALNLPPPAGWNQCKPRYIQIDPQNPKKVVGSTVLLPYPETGYTSVRYPSCPKQSLENFGNFVFGDIMVPFLVRNGFKEQLKKAVRRLDMRGIVKVSRKPSGPAVTILITPQGHHKISVDFAPVIQSRMEFCARHGWPRTNARWPSREKIQEIKKIGINCTAKRDFDWLESFAECEKELVKEIDKDGGCRKKCHRIMKSLIHESWCPGSKPVLTSYVLKNVWFWECVKYPNGEDWKNELLWTRVEGLTNSLLIALQERSLPAYFYPAVDLIKRKDPQKLDSVIKNIHGFMDDPERYLRCSS